LFGGGGVIYGAAFGGGSANCSSSGCGTVYELMPPKGRDASWSIETLHVFDKHYRKNAADGYGPNGVTLDAAGNIFGTTYGGGDINEQSGVVYELTSGSKSEKVLHDFICDQGCVSLAALIKDSKGNFYGTAVDGPGIGGGAGVVFQLSPPAGGAKKWTYTLLYSFNGGEDGSRPEGSLVFDNAGNLYGTTYRGGGQGDYGTVFEISPPAQGKSNWTEQVIHSFAGQDGSGPSAGLLFDTSGNLYGSAETGGTNNAGVIFSLAPPSNGKHTWKEAVIYNFTGGSDGLFPVANLISDKNGALYSTTIYGGGTTNCLDGDQPGVSCGVVLKLTPPAGGTGKWTETVLYSFTGRGDGGAPASAVVADSAGNLYGTATQGGKRSGRCESIAGAESCGVVYELTDTGFAP
jgi:uncharacterized repeat protein (TIGR03803 family)